MGLGLGGFIDGIVLHQILQWHHMLTDTGERSTQPSPLWTATSSSAWRPLEQCRPLRPGLPPHGRSRFWARSPRPSQRPRFETRCARPACALPRHPQGADGSGFGGTACPARSRPAPALRLIAVVSASALHTPARDEQTSVLVFDRHLLLRASGRLRLRWGLGRCVAQVPLGGNRGGNQVGTNRVPSWPLVSPRVTRENGGVQAIPRGERGSRLLGRPPTEPKVTGSNPVGRALDRALQGQIQGNHSKLGAAGWEQDGNRTPPVRRQAERVRREQERGEIERRFPHLKLYERRPMNGAQLLLDHAVPSRGSLWPTDSRRWTWPA